MPNINPEYPPNNADNPLESVAFVVIIIIIHDATITANGIYITFSNSSLLKFSDFIIIINI